MLFSDGVTIGTRFAIAGGTLGTLIIVAVVAPIFCTRHKARKLADNVEDVDKNPVYGEYSELYVVTEVQDTNVFCSST